MWLASIPLADHCLVAGIFQCLQRDRRQLRLARVIGVRDPFHIGTELSEHVETLVSDPGRGRTYTDFFQATAACQRAQTFVGHPATPVEVDVAQIATVHGEYLQESVIHVGRMGHF